MILSELRDYIQQRHQVSMADLVQHFRIEAPALRGMLHKWIQKGSVRVLPLKTGCGTSCCQCDALLTEMYEWINKSSPTENFN